MSISNFSSKEERDAYFDFLQNKTTCDEEYLKKFFNDILSDKDYTQTTAYATIRKQQKPYSYFDPSFFDRLQQSQSKKDYNIMSNKFLPFVVENSTPIYIYSTLLSRSKGIPTDLILSVFSAILKMGITKVREYAQNLPEMSVEQLYGEIVNQFIPSERIDRENLGFFDDVCAWINQNLEAEDSWLNPELNKFSALDAYSFLYIMRYESLNYCDYDFSVFYNNEKDIQENLPFYVNLSNDGRPIQVKDSKDLYAFIASLIITADSQTYKIILEPNESLPF